MDKENIKNQGFSGSIYKDCLLLLFFSCGHGGIRCSHVEIESAKNSQAYTCPLDLLKIQRSNFNRPVYFTIDSDAKLWETNFTAKVRSILAEKRTHEERRTHPWTFNL